MHGCGRKHTAPSLVSSSVAMDSPTSGVAESLPSAVAEPPPSAVVEPPTSAVAPSAAAVSEDSDPEVGFLFPSYRI